MTESNEEPISDSPASKYLPQSAFQGIFSIEKLSGRIAVFIVAVLLLSTVLISTINANRNARAASEVRSKQADLFLVSYSQEFGGLLLELHRLEQIYCSGGISADERRDLKMLPPYLPGVQAYLRAKIYFGEKSLVEDLSKLYESVFDRVIGSSETSLQENAICLDLSETHDHEFARAVALFESRLSE